MVTKSIIEVMKKIQNFSSISQELCLLGQKRQEHEVSSINCILDD